MVKTNVTARELAVRVGITYEHVRKLLRGLCLPSESTLDKLCAVIFLNKKEMQENVSRDKMIYRYGDAVWRAAGIDPRAASSIATLSRSNRNAIWFFLLPRLPVRRGRSQFANSRFPAQAFCLLEHGHDRVARELAAI